MKKSILSLLTLLSIPLLSVCQTNLAVDGNDILISNNKLVIQSPYGQSFFTGRQIGNSYSFPSAIFRAITDNPTGSTNFYFDGLTNGITKFSVRADGEAYFAGGLRVETSNSGAMLNLFQASQLGSAVKDNSLLTTSGGNVGSGNNFQHNTWLVRNQSGQDWFSTRLHDGIAIDGSYQLPQVNSRSWWERDPFNNIQSWGDGQDTYLTINRGAIGIGTSYPDAKLKILASIQNETFASPALSVEQQYKDFGNNNLIGAATSYKTNNTAESWTLGTIAGTVGTPNNIGGFPGGLAFYTKSADNSFNSAPVERMRIDHQGFVGIGTPSPKEALSVNGNIRSREVKVEATNWPDYVFNPKYELPSLEELHTYVKRHQHLPDVPAEEEITRNGLNLGEMNKILTKKIEELTLYLIEQNKQLQAQKAINSDLNLRVMTIEKLVGNRKRSTSQ